MDDDAETPQAETSIVRPYVITGGRTRSSQSDLPIETVLEVTSTGTTTRLNFERQAIASLCVEPISIAEMASALDLPLGVTRVLACDMTSEGLLWAHGSADHTDTLFIAELIEGIKSL